ncbi:MAG: cobyric acid synthase [Anaerovorax sp.]|nr:cobyric acid synthase [Anaerovorax sp.]
MGKSIMIQGTSSGAGKSTLVTGLCRVLKQAGYSVAPFKAQNLSSNAHVFEDGMEMARSQAIAAYACGISPETDMNPVLLKPTAIGGSEVILNGKSIGYLKDFEYKSLKKRLAENILEAYNRLVCQYDIVVVEGAGSPVELNIKQEDVVNMGFARKAKCPVLLVSDISRGGVFASIYGTIMLLDEEERELVKGIIVNKFRGKTEYFKSGVDILEELTQKPIMGILPYTSIEIEDEDSLVDGNMKTEKNITERLNGEMSYAEYIDIQFDKLADVVRQNIDITQLLKMLGE